MIGSSAAFLIMLNLLVKKWCRSHKRTLTCFRLHFVQEKQLATILSNIHQLTTFPTSLIMISKLYPPPPPPPPPHTHTINNYRLLSIVDVWRKKDEMVAPPQLPTHPKKLTVRERKTSRTAPIHCTGNRRFGITEFEGNQPKHTNTQHWPEQKVCIREYCNISTKSKPPVPSHWPRENVEVLTETWLCYTCSKVELEHFINVNKVCVQWNHTKSSNRDGRDHIIRKSSSNRDVRDHTIRDVCDHAISKSGYHYTIRWPWATLKS